LAHLPLPSIITATCLGILFGSIKVILSCLVMQGIEKIEGFMELRR